MADFKTALEALARGELKLDKLVHNLDKLLRKQPALAEQILGELRHAYAHDVIDAQTYASLKKRVQDVAGVTTHESGNADEATRLASADQKTMFAGQSDETEVISDADVAEIAAEARSATHIDITTGTSTGVDFDLSSPSTGSGDSWGSKTGTGQTGTGWTAPHKPAPTEQVKIAPGAILKERFRLMEVLGVGGMGTVYRGVDLLKEEARDRNPSVALKVLNEDFKQHPDAFIALQREASRQQKLAHPNIATVYDFDRTGATVYIVMELMEGQPLNNYIKKDVKAKGGLSFEEALPIVQGLGEGLVYAHDRKMVHSDFKPGNCFLLKDGNVKILDFGIARAVKNPLQGEGEKTLFDPGKLGALTPAYASAEMLEGQDPDPRDDIYALACVAYELLTGKHPFNKLPANSARDNKLVPPPIKGLKRKQMKGLMRGLAFAREDRSQSVQQFLEEFEGRSDWYKNPFVIAAGVAGIIAIGAVKPVIDWMAAQEVKQAIADVTSGVPTNITGVIDQLPKLGLVSDPEFSDEQERDILGNDAVGEALKNFYLAEVQSRIEANEWSAADSAVRRIESLYPNSLIPVPIRTTYDDARSNLEARLSDRYNKALEEGRLLPDEAADDIGDVLAAVQQFDPTSTMLTNPARVSAAFSQRANDALANGQFEPAAQLALTGLALIKQFTKADKDDVNLLNLRDKVRNTKDRVEQEALIAGAEARIRENESVLTALPGYRRISAAVLQLASAAPAHPTLGEVSARLKPLLDAEIARIQTASDWAAAETLNTDLRAMITALRVDSDIASLDGERRTYGQKADAFLTRLSAALAAGALGPPADPNANAIVAEIAAALPGSARLAQAREIVAQAHLRVARKARAAADFDAAQAALAAGAALKPGDAVGEALKAEVALVARLKAAGAADRDALLAEQKTQANALTTQVEQALAAMQPTVDDANGVLAALDRLEAADPTNARIELTRAAVAKKLAEGAAAANEAGNWDGAVETLRAALALVPEADTLGTSLGALQADAQTALANAQKKAIEASKAQLDKLLADKTFDAAWDRAVQAEFTKLQPFLAADDPWLTATLGKYASAYIERATQMRTEQRYEEAASSLAKAERYGPQLEALASEKSALAAAQAEFEKARAEELKLAEIEGLKSTLSAQAKAKDVSNAKKALDKLRGLLPATDPYLTTEIPKLLGDAYVNTAKSQADKKNFLAALKVAREGLEVAPNHPGLTKAVRDYTVSGNEAELTPMFSGEFTEIDVEGAKQRLNEIQQVNATEGSRIASALEQLAVARINALRESQPSIHNELLEQAKQVFPGGTQIAALKPAVEKRELKPCKNCALAQNAVKKGQLTKAQSILADAKADPNDKDHPDLVRAESALSKAVAAADAALGAYDAAQKEIAAKPKKTRDELDNLSALLAKARDLWNDRDYQAQDDWLQAEFDKLPKVTTGPTVGYPGQVINKGSVVPYTVRSPQQCSDKLATYGTRAKGQCFDFVDADKPGPPLVVVPAGAGGKAFAISRFEIRFGDYNRFCTVSGWCKPIPVPKEQLTLPVTQISVADAKAYAEWLSRRTGDTYRLPTAEEWAYAAEAGGKQPKKDWNCRLEQGGQILKGQGIMAANSGKPNGWGLFQYVGNVQEWVTSGGSTVVRGGSYQDSYSKCEISLERSHDGNRDQTTGFRLVKELG